MKNIALTVTFLLSISAFGLEIKASSFTAISNNKIEALVSKTGVYARLDDVREGFENFSGTRVTATETIINIKNDLSEIILNNGIRLPISTFRVIDGGDMGGGGK